MAKFAAKVEMVPEMNAQTSAQARQITAFAAARPAFDAIAPTVVKEGNHLDLLLNAQRLHYQQCISVPMDLFDCWYDGKLLLYYYYCSQQSSVHLLP